MVKLADLSAVEKPKWADTPRDWSKADWWFVWYGRYEGPTFSKAPPLSFPFVLEITDSDTGYGGIICEILSRDKGWRYLSNHSRQHIVYGAIPQAERLVVAIRKGDKKEA